MSAEHKIVSNDRVQRIIKAIKNGEVAAIHYKDCKCITCTYNYPDKTSISELIHSHRSMEMAVGGELMTMNERQVLVQILLELREMRKQEKDYWETWKQAKNKETRQIKEKSKP